MLMIIINTNILYLICGNEGAIFENNCIYLTSLQVNVRIKYNRYRCDCIQRLLFHNLHIRSYMMSPNVN